MVAGTFHLRDRALMPFGDLILPPQTREQATARNTSTVVQCNTSHLVIINCNNAMTEDASRNNMSNQKTEVNPSSKRKDSEEESRLREKLKRKKEGRDRDRDRDRDLHRPKNEASSATTSKQPVATKDKLPPDASGKITGRDKESSNGNGKSAMDKPSKSGTDIQDKTSTSRGRSGSGSGSNTNANSKSGSKRNRNKRRRERRRDVARDRMRNEAPGYRGHGHGPPGPYGGGHDPRHGHDPRFGHGHGFPHGHGPPEMMDSRSYYSQDFHYGMGGPGRHEPPYGREPYRGGGGGRGGGGWDGRPRGGYPDGRGGGRYDDHRGSVDRDRDRFGRHYRGGERGRSRSRSFSRSRSRNRSGSSISDRSYSSASNRSYSSGGSRSSSRSRSYSSSSSRSRSRNRDRSHSSDHHSKSRSKSRSRGRRSPTDRKRQRRSSSASSKNAPGANKNSKEDELTKDQRTVFVSQLVMKAGERDIQKYFNKKLGLKVNDVILLRDKRTGRHKGCAYVELANLVDVPKSVEASGKVPDFQRFPILVKASEAEKNGVVTNISVGVGGMGALGLGVVDESNKRTEAQKLYIGNIDQAVTQSQLYAIFSQFGQLDRVLLQLDPATGLSKGFAFLSFQDPKVANLAMTTVSGQILAGKAM